MAVDMFMKFDSSSNITGEAQDKTHKGETDVLAWSFGMSNSGTTHMGQGGGSGKVNVQDLSFTKWVDSGSPALMLACCNGQHIPSALLTVRKAGKTPLEYIKITLTEVMVVGVSTGGSGGEDRLTENVTLNFSKVQLDYTPQKSDGTADTVKSITWDIAANTND
jgi:type VI secretion system secreted protein Hcp